MKYIAPENQWLEYDPFLLGRPIFRGYVSFREGRPSSVFLNGIDGIPLPSPCVFSILIPPENPVQVFLGILQLGELMILR